MDSTLSTLKTFFRIALDILFPQSDVEAEILALSPDEFRVRAAQARYDKELEKLSAVACFWYRDPLVRHALHLLKFGKRHEVVELFGESLADEVLGILSEELGGVAMPLVIPIPLSKSRLRERGFNQSSVLARNALTHIQDGVEFRENILVRTREHERQTRMPSRAERLKNMKGVFAVSHPEVVRGRTVILIDDVITTGATMHDAKRALRVAGARAVHVVAVAH